MNKRWIPPYRSESYFNRHLLEFKTHVSVIDSYVESDSLYVLTVASPTDPSIVREIAVTAIDDQRCAVVCTEGLKSLKCLFADLEGTVTLTSEFLWGEVGTDRVPQRSLLKG